MKKITKEFCTSLTSIPEGLADVNSLPLEIHFKGSRVFLRCYDYYDEDADDICYCVEYKNYDGHPKIWSYSLLKNDALNKMAVKLRELGFNGKQCIQSKL